ncbi:SDR family NAD(P)-dependent oxidoreductase [Rhodococcus sp. NPDC057529]|uniref:SDR family NAD(P)-dependent oxidoreductase n=1 Tax=Rhodococcus sp. NPDC057529 TaxID=3346158 RepID=UPI00366A93F8
MALVTGGASGIGAECARAFADAGAKVLVCDRNEEAGREVVDGIGSAARFASVDVRSADAVAGAVEQAVSDFGGLDVVFNNAGAGFNALLVDHSDQHIDDLLDINLRATILVCRAAMPHLLNNESGGVIINNASNGGVIGRAPDPVYVATKHGVVGFTKSLALAHAHQGIRVNAICPGPIDTPMLWGNFKDVPRDEALHRILATCPDPRVATTEEVAATVVFLASDAARFINGVALPIDGAKAAGVMPGHRYRLDFPLSAEAEELVR